MAPMTANIAATKNANKSRNDTRRRKTGWVTATTQAISWQQRAFDHPKMPKTPENGHAACSAQVERMDGPITRFPLEASLAQMGRPSSRSPNNSRRDHAIWQRSPARASARARRSATPPHISWQSTPPSRQLTSNGNNISALSPHEKRSKRRPPTPSLGASRKPELSEDVERGTLRCTIAVH